MIALLFLVSDETKLMQKLISSAFKKELQDDINRLTEWSEKLKLKFSTSKCKVIGMISQTHTLC